jgi:hypothetical protein
LNKIIYIPAFFEPVGNNKTIKIPTGEKKKGLFGGEKDVTREETKWEQTGWSECRVDSQRLAEDLSSAVKTLNDEGYEVVSVTPVTSGAYEYKKGTFWGEGEGGYAYGYGYSYTNSLIVTARVNA